MGRNDHASFSSRGRSNPQVLEKKMRKTGLKVTVKKGKESEKREEVCKNVEKARKRFWWKWMSFVRGHWSGLGTLRPEGSLKSVPTALQSLDSASESSPTSMDVIEIPIESGQKISKILIKPTRTGIKAMIAQCRTPLRAGRTPPRDNWPPSEDTSWDGKTLAHTDTRFSEDRGQSRDRSANWSRRIFKNEGETSGSKETLLTSALFIREDMDNIVESAVFIEPNLPNDYTDSKKSDELSQKSIKINKRRVSYRIVDERHDSVRRTIKTVSEPTWIEREKILHRQRLHEDINNLLEQFMFLESEDVIGLTIPHSRSGQERKTIRFDSDSWPAAGGHLIKEISREVSPEILVNIKPFKEYLSDDYLLVGSSTPHGEKQQSQRGTGGPGLSSRKPKTGAEENERAEECACPPILNRVFISEQREYAEVLRNYSGFGGGVQREAKRTRYGDCEELSSLASVGCIGKEESPMCTIWGVCKTYSACNTATGPGDGARGLETESLDKLLETLDDSDHGLVFQKNISQFRKKINVVPRLDPRKSSAKAGETKRTEHKKMMKRPQSYLELVKPIIECVVEESEEEEREGSVLEAVGKKKTGAQSVWGVENWASEETWASRFVRYLAAFCGRTLMSRTLGNRTEEAMVNVVGRLREAYTLVESSRRTVLQREMAGMSREVELICRTGRGPAGTPEEVTLKKLMPGIEGSDSELPVSEEEIPRSMSVSSNASECFYVDQILRFGESNPQQPNGCDAKDLELLEKADGKWSERAGGRSSGGPNGVTTLEPTLGSTRMVIQILDSMAFDYVTTILGTSGQKEPELGMESVLSDYNARENSRVVGEPEKQPGSPVDGFQILYNNDRESLNDDDEDAMKADSVKSLDERKHDVVFAVEESDNKDVEDEAENEEMKGGDGKGEGLYSDEGAKWPQVGKEKLQRFLKYKSSSSPRENIIVNELGCQEHRTRRSLVLLKEVERDLQNCKKRRLSGDKGVEVRRTGSALLELHSAKLVQDASFLQKKKSGFGGEKTFESLVLPEGLKANPDRDQKTLDGRKMLVTNRGGLNVRKEVIAAFNSIKELGAWKAEAKGGNKRMSLVIMLSKK